MTTNKNKTAIAPTYTTKKTIAKKSSPKRIKRPAPLKKTKIKNIITNDTSTIKTVDNIVVYF